MSYPFLLRAVCGLLALCAMAAQATGLEALDAFIKNTRSGRAQFVQQVTSPPKEGHIARVRNSSGSFEFLRPNRFRFVFKKPLEQVIVADGQTLWLYDVDLAQATARKQAQALGSAPAALIASATDLRAMEAEFELSNAAPSEGQDWVLARPRSKDGGLQSVRVGFKGATLATLEILDSFGQRSVMQFTQFEANPPLDNALFQFKPPAGVDVLRQ
ncbi:MAG: outer membrane lipoprotein chaperone LolA [Rhodoferax sp.]|nr:outer membrane lipoprotein chaperone LolA [Rhodoferax sp.]